MLGEQSRAIKIKAAQETALSALGNSVYYRYFRTRIKFVHNFIHNSAASVISTLFNKIAASEAAQMCLLFHNL